MDLCGIPEESDRVVRPRLVESCTEKHTGESLTAADTDVEATVSAARDSAVARQSLLTASTACRLSLNWLYRFVPRFSRHESRNAACTKKERTWAKLVLTQQEKKNGLKFFTVRPGHPEGPS